MGIRIRLTTWPTVPERNENTRLVRMLLRRADLPGSVLTAVEMSTYFAGGSSPVHAESHSEEVVYVRRGAGRVLLGEDYVDVAAGDAVAIPPGVTHRVVNSGQDALEHVLVGANVLEPAPGRVEAPTVDGSWLVDGPAAGMHRLSCLRTVVEPGAASGKICYPGHEVVYAVSGGCAVLHVSAVDLSFEWEFAVDSSHVFWLPPGHPHYFRNVGDGPLRLVSFPCVMAAPVAS